MAHFENADPLEGCNISTEDLIRSLCARRPDFVKLVEIAAHNDTSMLSNSTWPIK